MCHTHLELDPEADANVAAVFDAAVATERAEPDDGRTFDQLQADVLVELITGARTTDPRVPECSVLIDLHTLLHGLHDASVSETADGQHLPPDVIRRMGCEADIIPIVLNGDRVPIDVGRARRLATREQRQALQAMYATCGHPHCEVRFAACRIHHVDWWDHHGPTDLANLVPLCARHHHLVHEGGWTLTLKPDRTITLRRPDGSLAHEGTTTDRTPPRTNESEPPRPPPPSRQHSRHRRVPARTISVAVIRRCGTSGEGWRVDPSRDARFVDGVFAGAAAEALAARDRIIRFDSAPCRGRCGPTGTDSAVTAGRGHCWRSVPRSPSAGPSRRPTVTLLAAAAAQAGWTAPGWRTPSASEPRYQQEPRPPGHPSGFCSQASPRPSGVMSSSPNTPAAGWRPRPVVRPVTKAPSPSRRSQVMEPSSSPTTRPPAHRAPGLGVPHELDEPGDLVPRALGEHDERDPASCEGAAARGMGHVSTVPSWNMCLWATSTSRPWNRSINGTEAPRPGARHGRPARRPDGRRPGRPVAGLPVGRLGQWSPPTSRVRRHGSAPARLDDEPDACPSTPVGIRTRPR